MIPFGEAVADVVGAGVGLLIGIGLLVLIARIIDRLSS